MDPALTSVRKLVKAGKGHMLVQPSTHVQYVAKLVKKEPPME